jgi:hypothetical protein
MSSFSLVAAARPNSALVLTGEGSPAAHRDVRQAGTLMPSRGSRKHPGSYSRDDGQWE